MRNMRARYQAAKVIDMQPESELSHELLKKVEAEHIQDIFSESVEQMLLDDIKSKEIVEKKELEMFLFK